MAFPNDLSTPRSFRLYVTHVDGEGHFLRISGQLDNQASLMVESLFETARENLEQGIGAVPPAAIQEGVICAAKYKDGTYYRAKVINTSNLTTGLVGVHFIDFGNRDIISLSTIRLLDNYDPMFVQLRGQASDFYLSRVMHPAGRWDEPLLLKLQSLLCYSEYPATVDAQTRIMPIISLQFKGTDLSTHLVSNRFGIALPVQKQEVLILQISGETQQIPNWQPNYVSEPQYTEHVPFLINPSFPSNPASAMRLQQNVSIPYNGSVPPPSMISQRLQVNKVPRTPVNLKAPARQPQHTPPSVQPSATPPVTPVAMAAAKPPSPKKSITYKSRLLEVNSQHKVFVSFAEEGPELFAVQLVTDAKKLQDMMDDINRRPHSSLAEPPMIGTVCLGRMSGDRIICRAIVMNLSGSQCKLFFVDFGDTEMVSYYDIFDIPEEFVKPNVFAMRFCLSGVKKLEKGPHLNEVFKQLVNGKVLTLRVVSPEGPPLIQYGELYLDNKNVLELLLANMKDKLQFKWMEMLALSSKKSVLVSYVDSCIKFYAQLSEKIEELNAVMDAVKVHCESSSSPGELPVGAACCARFPDDDNWYRARIRDVKGNKVTVAYVDYGNEQDIEVSDLRTITPELIKLPAQALKCALKGFENKPVETKTSNQLEMLALEKTLMAQIVGVLSNDTMLVSLVDDTVSPPLDVARRMTQLSQPRSNIEPKVATPVRKDAPETFSSPEDGDERKKGFRREKSFKDERRPPREVNEDFGRTGSFRSGDKEPFDRAGTGRHSDKFGGRPDKGDRRGGSKPWETNAPAPAPSADDEWQDSAPTPQTSFQPPPRQNRDNNRDRRKPRSDQEKGQRPVWKGKDLSGVGKRLRQATEAASADTKNVAKGMPVQDRLKRDTKFNQQDECEEKKDDWGNRNSRDNRPDRRDNRGDRRDNRGDRDSRDNRDNRDHRDNRDGRDNSNWGDKKDSFQKRDFRENRERGDRAKSNFTPRDRADRSFGSDSDKKSDRSFRAQDSGGRAPPYKSRSKFTQVQYKELSDPVELTTAFEEPTVEVGAQHEVSVTWIISPESFYTQILSLQPKFLEMMHTIPELYKGVKSFTGDIPIGASVLARYPADGVLYRATVVSAQPIAKFIVQYIDFGNKQLVDAKDIWQLERQLLELPQMAVHCSLLGVSPKDGDWKANPEIDICFNGPRYQSVFQECVEGQWKVALWNNGVSVADMLVEKGLGMMSDHQSSVALKDEAIDLTIIIGQQILCKVTHVESFEKFYVQLDLDKAALVESAIAEFDTAKLTALAADSLTDGVHCTVKHEEKIYRAILSDVSDTENIQAVLPDYGISIVTTLANLMILPTELSVYYYQSLECCLNNYTAESTKLVTLEELGARLVGNKFIVYINDVEGISLVATLYDVATGQKVAMFEPDEGAYDEVVPLCARAVHNYNFGMAYIPHAENLNEFYLQRASDSDRLAMMLEELYKFYEEGTPEAVTSFEVDSLCAAKSADGNWYRAAVVAAQETDVKVQFSDYGNSETVPKDSVKALDPKFFEPCALALVASLGLVALQDDALAKLIEWTTDKEVQVTLAFGNDGWLASLHLDGIDLAIKLVNEKLATPQISANEETVKEEPLIEEPISLPAGCTQVYISHIDTPGHFWLQMVDKMDKIDEIQTDLQANAGTYADIENRELGTLCVAKYLADDQWYRAEILDSDSDITTVRFIDYGNTDVLDNQPDLIKAMPDHLKEVERYALKSSVNAVPTGTGEWSEPAGDCFTKLVGDLTAAVDALIVLKDVTTYVDIFVNGQNLTDKLVSEGYATRSEETECGGDLPSCFASHINSPSEFWIQLETATAELQAMEAAIVDVESFPELTDKEDGVICAAKYPEDGSWYRAQVIVDGSEGTEVLFMDYGNASIANELRSLPDELKVKPALSRKCALQKPRDIKTWSRKSEIKFNELAAEGATIFNVQFIASGDISIVELYLEGKSVTEELVGLCEEHPATERPTPVGQDLHSNGKVCYVNSLDEFYVQLDDSTPELDKVFERLNSAAEFEPVSELKAGSTCAAFWDEDEQWYRAKILELCDVGYHAQFIDYGNKAKCEEFRQLPENLAAIKPVAKCCRLAGLSEDSSANDVIKAKLDELAAEESTTFQIEFLDSTKEPALVKLLIDGKDIIYLAADATADTVVTPAVTTDTVVISESVSETISEVISTTNENKVDSGISASENDTKESRDIASDITTLKVPVNEDVQVSKAVVVEANIEAEIEQKVAENDADDIFDEKPCTELNSSQPDLNDRESSDIASNITTMKVLVNEDVQVSKAVVVEANMEAKIEQKIAEYEAEDIFDEKPCTELNTFQPDLNDLESSDIASDITTVKIPVSEDIQVTKAVEVEANIEAEIGQKVAENEADDNFDEPCTELNTSQPDMNDSVDSSNTVIENKSFVADSLLNDIISETQASPQKGETSPDTLDNSNETIKSPDRDSLNSDTSYTSCGDHDKSPMKDDSEPLGNESVSPKEISVSPIEIAETSQDEKKEETEVSSEKSVSEILTVKEPKDKNITNTKVDSHKQSPIKEASSPKKESQSHAETVSQAEVPTEKVNDNVEKADANVDSPQKSSANEVSPKKDSDPAQITPALKYEMAVVNEQEQGDTKIESPKKSPIMEPGSPENKRDSTSKQATVVENTDKVDTKADSVKTEA